MEEVVGEEKPAADSRHGYTVTVEKGSLESEPHSDNVKYSVSLSGAVDERWCRAFHIVQLDSTGFFLYRLEPIYRIVTFQLPSDAHPTRVTRLVERLERLVGDVNHSASLWGGSA